MEIDRRDMLCDSAIICFLQDECAMPHSRDGFWDVEQSATETEHGEYLAMKELFGGTVALRVAMKGDMKVPGFVTTQQKRDVVYTNYLVATIL